VSRAFQFQDPGEGIHEAEVGEVLVSEGDEVEEGQDVLLVETDKATFEVSAAFGGTVREVRVSEGQIIHVGDDLLLIDEPDEPADDEAGAQERGDEPASEEESESEDESDQGSEEGSTDEDETRDPPASEEDEEPEREPAASAEAGDEPGSGAEAEERRRRKPSRAREGDGRPVPAAPSTRRVARELGVDLAEVAPGGDDGRVRTEDVRAHAEAGSRDERAEKEEEPASALPDLSRFGPIEREPLRSVRRTTARRLARSWEQIPHVTHGDVADITELERLRRRHVDELRERDGELTLTVFLLKAAAAALRAHPRFNASFDAQREEVVYRRYHHIGVAVDGDRGLLVPVVRDVDHKSLVDLAVELPELAERARRGETTRDELTGGTFTITNVGSLGGTHFTPIIDLPQVAILGVGRAELRPVVQGDLEHHELVPRLLLPLSLGFDHRVNDGADAARFLNEVRRLLGDPEAFALSA